MSQAQLRGYLKGIVLQELNFVFCDYQNLAGTKFTVYTMICCMN